MDKTRSNPDTARLSATAGELRIVLGKLVRRLREQAQSGDLTPSQLSVLGRLERDGPTTVTSLARAEGMRPQSMGANVSALQLAGFISGTPDAADGRQTIWALTDACREWAKASRAAREDWLLGAIHAKLTLPEQIELARAVHLLQRLIEP